MKKKITYKSAGVDIDRANKFVDLIKPLIRSTARKEVRGDIGGYAGLFNLDTGRFKNPVLVSSTDGVGTKLNIAQIMDKHDTIGIDLVAMSVNDVIVLGAEPLFFLDYIACGRLRVESAAKIVEGIARGCAEAGCALIGGETAEMPGFYPDGKYDLAGFCVGVVEAERLIDGSGISVGDRVIGLASSGLHSNGYSLARKVLLENAAMDLESVPEGFDRTLGTELLAPTRIYAKAVLNLTKSFNVKGLVHVTGGGFFDNIPRILPAPCRVVIRKDSWTAPPVFRLIQETGRIDSAEMYRVFNMGIGMILIVPDKEAGEVLDRLGGLGENAFSLGVVEKKRGGQPSVILE
ncbi:MAG: phosphoribosylformylglycinamidine cyclo-ligase [Syntrophales bacterium]